jgi:hypothetical protein
MKKFLYGLLTEPDFRDKYLEDWQKRNKFDWGWLFGRILIPAVFNIIVISYFVYLISTIFR